MARVPMVTRTFNTQEVVLMVVNTETAEVTNATVKLGRVYKDDEAILKVARPLIETDSSDKVVAVVSVSVDKALYGMSEEDFLAHAKKLKDNETDTTGA